MIWAKGKIFKQCVKKLPMTKIDKFCYIRTKSTCSSKAIVTKPGLSFPTHSKPKHWDTEVCIKEGLFARQPNKETEQIPNPHPWRQVAQHIYRVMNKEQRQWGAWGKVIRKRCSNHHSVQAKQAMGLCILKKSLSRYSNMLSWRSGVLFRTNQLSLS